MATTHPRTIAARKEEIELRSVEEEHGNLKSAREVSKQIEKEIEESGRGKKKEEEEIEAERKRLITAAAKVLADSEAGAPNLQEAERKLFACAKMKTKSAVNWAGRSKEWMFWPLSAPAKRILKISAKNSIKISSPQNA